MQQWLAGQFKMIEVHFLVAELSFTSAPAMEVDNLRNLASRIRKKSF